MNLDQAKITLVEVSRELLHSENGEYDEEAINALFRSSYTIKTSATLFNFENIVVREHFLPLRT